MEQRLVVLRSALGHRVNTIIDERPEELGIVCWYIIPSTNAYTLSTLPPRVFLGGPGVSRLPNTIWDFRFYPNFVKDLLCRISSYTGSSPMKGGEYRPCVHPTEDRYFATMPNILVQEVYQTGK